MQMHGTMWFPKRRLRIVTKRDTALRSLHLIQSADRRCVPSQGKAASNCLPKLCGKEHKKRLPLEGKLSPKVTDEV